MNSTLVHPRGFWLFDDPDLISHHHMFDLGLAESLAQLFDGCSVIDLGCGVGKYVEFLARHGVDITGVDGNPHTRKLSGGLCDVVDLSQPVSLGRQYDWVLSLEVGEHIPARYESVFISNVVNHALRGIVLSWSCPEIESGRGLGHVNCRTNRYVRLALAQRGWHSWPEKETVLRRASTLYHFRRTLMVLKSAAP